MYSVERTARRQITDAKLQKTEGRGQKGLGARDSKKTQATGYMVAEDKGRKAEDGIVLSF
jgi:hypothetical protein